jgi:hypothetical protein
MPKVSHSVFSYETITLSQKRSEQASSEEEMENVKEVKNTSKTTNKITKKIGSSTIIEVAPRTRTSSGSAAFYF